MHSLLILFIEDNPDDVELMTMELERANGFKITPVRADTESGLRRALFDYRFDGIVCDYRMPQMTFEKALSILDEFGLDIVFILVSGQISQDQLRVTLKDNPRIFAFVDKDKVGLLATVFRRAMDGYRTYDRMYTAWGKLMSRNDTETQAHTRRVTELSVQLAERMGVPKSKLVHIERGALLHDIGKIGIPDEILKKPGPLTEAEWVIMRMHPVYGYEDLSAEDGDNGYMTEPLLIVRHHHEKWDGTGYPDKLKGESIPLFARIFSVADVYDALTDNDRPYRKAWTKAEALKHLQDYAGTQFDGRAVRVFVKMMEDRNG
jgi:HD-GYP domain-containing protein (c-di-GMP phosphodiesterase class II)